MCINNPPPSTHTHLLTLKLSGTWRVIPDGLFNQELLHYMIILEFRKLHFNVNHMLQVTILCTIVKHLQRTVTKCLVYIGKSSSQS